jgi:hypothetical protein
MSEASEIWIKPIFRSSFAIPAAVTASPSVSAASSEEVFAPHPTRVKSIVTAIKSESNFFITFLQSFLSYCKGIDAIQKIKGDTVLAEFYSAILAH